MMATYMIFRSMSSALQFQGRVPAKSKKKALQKWFDQTPEVPTPTKAESASDADYVVIKESSLGNYKVGR